MTTTDNRLVPDIVVTTVFGLVVGLALGGPLGAALLGGFGLFVGNHLDRTHALERELADGERRRGE